LYLIDTSIWIDYFRETKNSSIKEFSHILENNLPYAINSIIYQEILQGAATENDFNRLKTYLITQRFFHLKNKIVSYEAAAMLYFQCRYKGITVRSTIDCLIAQTALENNLILLHNDRDYCQIQSIIPDLQLLPNKL